MPPEIEDKIQLIFGGKTGQDVMEWLQGFTIRQVLGANASTGELYYKEGMRAVVALLHTAQANAQGRARKSAAKARKD